MVWKILKGCECFQKMIYLLPACPSAHPSVRLSAASTKQPNIPFMMFFDNGCDQWFE
jgi:hypothetical protein